MPVPAEIQALLDNPNEAYWRDRLANQGTLKAPPPRSTWRRFMDNLEEGMRRGPASLIATALAPFVETGDEKSYTERRKAFAEKEKQRRADFDIIDPPDSVGDYVTDIGGGIAGSLVSDPTNLITGGAKTLAGKALTAGAIGAGADAALQGAEILGDVRDEYNPLQTGINAAAGPVFVGAGYGLGKAKDKITARRAAKIESLDLDAAKKFGERFGTVTSTVRSKARNKQVGGVPNSYHLTGQAMDIARGKGISHKKIETALRRAGFDIIESLDEGDHSHFAFNFKKSEPKLAVDNTENIAANKAALQNWADDIDFNEGPKSAEQWDLEALLSQADDTNITRFPGEKRAPLTDDELNDILERNLQDNSNPFEGLLTPAEVRDMPAAQRAQMMRELAAPFEAAGPRPETRGALSEDILDSTIGQGRAATTPVNDLNVPKLTEDAQFDRVRLARESLDKGLINRNDFRNIVNDWRDAKDQTFIDKYGQKAFDKIVNKIEKEKNPSRLTKLLQLFKDIINDEEGSFRPFGRDSGPVEPPNPTLSKLNEAVKKAKDATPEQRKAYRAERKKRFAEVIKKQQSTSGVAGLRAEKAALKGELPRVDLENIRNQFTPEEIDTLMEGLKQSRLLSPGEKISARDAVDGLMDGRLPTPSELAYIARVYPDLVTSILKKRPLSERAADEFWKLWETWRGAMGSGDVSFSGRQGFMMVSRPEWWKATKDQFKVLLPEMGEARMRNQVERIVNSPHYSRATEGGLRLMDLGELRGGREEFAPQSYANKLPILGSVVDASNRAFTYNANELRFSIFSNLLDKWEAKGYDIDDPKLLKDAAKYINIFTGRGSLGKYDRALPLANLVMFAPRFVLSTFQRLNPILSPFTHPAVRKEAMRDAAAFVGVVGTALAGAQQAGYDVEWDPRNPTGLKIKHGKTTYDIGAGMTQTVSLLAKLLTNKKITGKGEEVELDSGDYGSDNAWDIWSRFVRTKLHPSMSYLVDWRVGENVVGEKFNALTDAAERFFPMFSTTVAEHLMEHGEKGAPVIPVAAFGVGVQTFEPPEKKKSSPQSEVPKDISDLFNDKSSDSQVPDDIKEMLGE